MSDTTTKSRISAYRETVLQQHDNRSLAKIIWIALALIASGIGAFTSILVYVEPAQSSLNYGPLLTLFGGILAWVVAFAFMGSLLYPALQLEEWLDHIYPDFHATEISEYRLHDDLLASFFQTVEWGIQMAGIYVFVAMSLVASAVLAAFVESGYQISAENIQTLTILNTFGVSILSGAFIAAAAYWLAKTQAAPATEKLSTPNTTTFVSSDSERDLSQYSPSDLQVTDGGPELKEDALERELKKMREEES